ncbi:MAG TPA: hypothetical protein PK112_07360, partial [candidate division Zixibacteria bacterium]|nr:hypothetical protein [candidate division Zixibacteria bacterium]
MTDKIISHPRDFPAVEELLQHPRLADLIARLPRPVAADVVRAVVAEAKSRLTSQDRPLTRDDLLAALRAALRAAGRQAAARVINATG